MFSQEELKQIHRRKQVIVARSDQLRSECGEIWGSVGRRTRRVGSFFNRFPHVPAVVSVVSSAAVTFLASRYLPRQRYLRPLLALARLPAGAADRDRQLQSPEKPAGPADAPSCR